MAPPIATLELAELATLFKVTLRTVQNWAKDGMPVRTVDRKRVVVLGDVLPWALKYFEERGKEKASPKGGSGLLRKVEAEARIKEMEALAMEGSMVPTELSAQRYEAFVGGFVSVATGQLARHERDIVAASTPAAARKVTQEIRTSLLQGARAMADQIERGRRKRGTAA